MISTKYIEDANLLGRQEAEEESLCGAIIRNYCAFGVIEDDGDVVVVVVVLAVVVSGPEHSNYNYSEKPQRIVAPASTVIRLRAIVGPGQDRALFSL